MQSGAPKNRTWFTFFVELAISVWIGSILGWAIATNVFDARFFTYFNLANGFAFYLILALAQTDSNLFHWALIAVLPIYICLTMFIYIAIVVIVQNNDWVFIRDSLFGGGELTIGEVHTGDWMFHYVPPVLLLVYVAVNFVDTAKTNYGVWSSDRVLFKVAYSLYVLITPALILGCYMVTMPFDKNYPTKMRTWQVCTLVFGLSTAIQLVYLAGSYSIATTLGEKFARMKEHVQ